MPYIKQHEREDFNGGIEYLAKNITNKGELNYVICELVSALILKYTVNYERISEWIDAVDGAENELRRRLLEPYENSKITQNGDLEGFGKVLNKMNKNRG